MKIVAIGDTHGRDLWKKVVEKELKSSDKMVFIGDYFDSFDMPIHQQIINFHEILELKENNPDKVELLFGNHDYHYMSGINEEYSGYRHAMRIHMHMRLPELVSKRILKMAYSHNDVLFTHAGVSSVWAERNGVDEDNNIANSINELFINQPLRFGFTPGRNFSNTGDDVTQTPIWIRPRSLYNVGVEGWIQVVGHTTQENGVTDYQKEGKIWLIDTIEESGEYLIYDDSSEQKFKIGFIYE